MMPKNTFSYLLREWLVLSEENENFPSAHDIEAAIRFADIDTKINLKYLMATSQDDVVSLINQKVDLIKSDLEKDARTYCGMTEDQLSSLFVAGFNRSGMDADHDNSRSGHVDIVVKDRRFNFEWYAEAKIWGGAKYLEGGFDQLFTRYASNNPNWNHGAMLVYYKNKRPSITEALGTWKSELPDNIETKQCPLDGIGSFLSTHIKPATNTPYHIRHTFVSLYYDPQK